MGTAPLRAPGERAADGLSQAGRDQSGPVVGQHDGIAVRQRGRHLGRERPAHGFRQRPRRVAVDADHLLFGGVNAAGENSRFHRRPVLPRAHDVRALDTARQTGHETTPLGVAADQPGETRAPTERGDVVGRVAGAARDHLGRIVFQDQHRRFPRHARDLPVDELVGDDVADHQHPAVAERLDQCEQPLLQHGRLETYDRRLRRIQLVAPIRLSATASAATSGAGLASSAPP